MSHSPFIVEDSVILLAYNFLLFFTPSVTSTPYLTTPTIWEMCRFSSRDREIKLRCLGYFPLIPILKFWCLPIGGILNLLTLKYLCLLLTSNNCSFLFGSSSSLRAQFLERDILESPIPSDFFVWMCVVLVVV